MEQITTIRRTPLNDMLSPYIKYFWSMKAPKSVVIDQWLLPVCNGDLTLNLSAPARCTDAEGAVVMLEGACICGIRRHCTRIEQEGPIHVIGASFKAAGLYPFITGSVGGTVDRTLPVETLMPEFVFDLSEEVPVDEEETLTLLERALLAILDNNDPRRCVIPEILTAFCSVGGADTIKTFCKANGISPRTLERLTKKYIGLSPREYISLARLQEAVRGMIDNPQMPLTAQAYEYGYFDQPHFTRAFREKLGRTPSDFKVCSNSILELIRRK